MNQSGSKPYLGFALRRFAGCFFSLIVVNFACAQSVPQGQVLSREGAVNFSRDITNWSETNANQLIGLQWQWTTNGTLDPDAGVGCPIDAKISDIRFLP